MGSWHATLSDPLIRQSGLAQAVGLDIDFGVTGAGFSPRLGPARDGNPASGSSQVERARFRDGGIGGPRPAAGLGVVESLTANCRSEQGVYEE